MNILVANIGSTSFKYRLFAIEQDAVLAQGRIERIGQPGGCPNYETALRQCAAQIAGPGKPLASLADLAAIGFKAVHAGPIGGARLVDEAMLAAMEEFTFFAPAHNPPYIAAMRSFGRALPHVPLVALFETAFFEAMDEASTAYAVPYAWRRELGIRRYGFHGASHRAASEHVQAIVGPHARHISCHLGGSSSIAAVRDGVAIDTSFGISPQSGLPQNNRVGDLDVFAALFVMKKRGLSVDRMAEILAGESGLAGISGLSGDIRDLDEAAAAGSPRARLAIDVLVRSARHYVGAFLVALGGLDVLTFSGGIGENSPGVRAGICAGLGDLGIALDEAVNQATRGQAAISADGSRVRVLVVPADEERIVARAAAALLAARAQSEGGPRV